jgi:Zn-dependent protease
MSDLQNLLPSLLLSIALAATAIILHELAHGYAALALGDETALRNGRLSLYPWRHVDRFGTLLLPGLLVLGQLATLGKVAFMFGWAKPVPVDASRFRAPRQMMALVALAGPAMNFALAFLAAHLFLIRGLSPVVFDAVQQFIEFNLVLGIFNLIPLPPLDGGRIAVGILPLKLAAAWAKLERYGIVVVLLLIAVPALLRQQGMQIDPLGSVLLPIVRSAFNGVLWLAGVRDGSG